MTGSDEEYITCPESTEKKKKQKHDESGKSIVKKSQCHSNEKRKKKKKKASVTEDALEIVDVVPKKKKGKALDEDIASCDLKINDGVPKKKKKKNVVDNFIESIDPAHKKKEKYSTVEDSKEIITKKKKLKKSKTESNLGDEATKPLNIGTDVSVSQKKKKKQSVQDVQSGSPKEDQPEMSDFTEVKKIKKKKKMASVEDDVIDGHEVHHGEEDGNSLRVSKKNKKRKQSITGEKSGHVDLDLNGNRGKERDIVSDGASKKKKRKQSVTGEKSGHVDSDLDGNQGKERDMTSDGASKKKKRKQSVTGEKSGYEDSDVKGKKKKRNKAKETAELADDADETLHVTCHKEKQKSKKRKKEKMLKDEELSAIEDTTEVPKKKQNKEETESKKSSKKREERIDVHPGPVQDGSTDEAHIDKGTKFGQWDTATFQNPEQQTKFLRLLGGFKKGNQVNLTSTSKQVKANMALGKQGEQVLERSLQAEFDKALSWKENRGIGLGFQPAPNKFFYIDKTASRSVKFED